MPDRLAALMTHFPLSARVFNAGQLCGLNTVENDGTHGQLHFVRQGIVEVKYRTTSLTIDRPSLLLFPRPLTHRFVTDEDKGADFVCAHLSYEGGAAHPLASALPEVVCLPLDGIAGAGPVLALLFEEAFQQRCGRVALIERLIEVVMIQVLRELMERGEVQGGLLAGLSHPRLRHALVAMHETPQREWTLEELAASAGMSRSAFAAAFRDQLGLTPGHYLQGWRIRLAQKALRRDRALKVIASEIGYGSEAALSRAFKAQVGLSPREWKAKLTGDQAKPVLE